MLADNKFSFLLFQNQSRLGEAYFQSIDAIVRSRSNRTPARLRTEYDRNLSKSQHDALVRGDFGAIIPDNHQQRLRILKMNHQEFC